MFGLLYNLYKYVQAKSERKVTIVLLGLDNAGKTTLSNTLGGELGAEVSPSFGFNKSSLAEGKYKIDIFDLGGGKNIRKIWKTYLAEVHGLVFVVDSADRERFAEACEVLSDLASEAAFQGKPLLVLANKQDLATSASPAEVALALGLSSLQHNSYNIMPCSARAAPPPAGGGALQADGRVRQALKWLVGQVDSVYTTLDGRVLVEAEAARQVALNRKRERDEAAKRAREERQRLKELEASGVVAVAAEAAAVPPLLGTPVVAEALGVVDTANVLSTIRPVTADLPNSIETPRNVPVPAALPSPRQADSAGDSHPADFSDLRPRVDQRASADRASSGRRQSGAGPPSLAALPASERTASRPNSGLRQSAGHVLPIVVPAVQAPPTSVSVAFGT